MLGLMVGDAAAGLGRVDPLAVRSAEGPESRLVLTGRAWNSLEPERRRLLEQLKRAGWKLTWTDTLAAGVSESWVRAVLRHPDGDARHDELVGAWRKEDERDCPQDTELLAAGHGSVLRQDDVARCPQCRAELTTSRLRCQRCGWIWRADAVAV